MNDRDSRDAGWVSVLKKYKVTVDSPESLAVAVDVLIEEARKAVVEEIALWLEKWEFSNRYGSIGDEIRDDIVKGIREDFSRKGEG